MNQIKERVEDSLTDNSFYNVIMFNDDVTPFEYVIAVLNDIFGYRPDEGFQIAMHIHRNGKAIVATLSMDEAYGKVDEVDRMNNQYGFLLQTNVEKA